MVQHAMMQQRGTARPTAAMYETMWRTLMWMMCMPGKHKSYRWQIRLLICSIRQDWCDIITRNCCICVQQTMSLCSGTLRTHNFKHLFTCVFQIWSYMFLIFLYFQILEFWNFEILDFLDFEFWRNIILNYIICLSVLWSVVLTVY